MKPSFKNAFKYASSIVLTVALTVVGVKAWAGLTASDGDTLDYVKWNQLVSTVQSWIPTGAIMAFDLPSCPTGWSPATAAIGRTVIGSGNGAGSNTNVGDTGGEKSAPAISLSASGLTLNWSVGGVLWNNPSNSTLGTYTSTTKIYSDATPTIPLQAGSISGTLTWGGTATDNMQPYVAYLYCRKN